MECIFVTYLCKKYMRFLLLVSILAAFSNYTVAQGLSGNTYDFLQIPSNARIAAAGGSLITVKDDDANLGLGCASLLNGSMNKQLSFNYNNYIGDVNMGSFVMANNFFNQGTYCIGLNYVDYGKIIRADATGVQDGKFVANETALNFGVGRILHDSIFSIGANLKAIYSAFDTYSSTGLAGDFSGTYYNRKKDFTATGIIKNAGFQIVPYVKGVKEDMPFEVQLGFSKRLKHLPLRFSIIGTNLQKYNVTYYDAANPPLAQDTVTGVKYKNFGKKVDNLGRHLIFNGEFFLTKNFIIRMGYNHLRRQELKSLGRTGTSGFSFGLGFKVSKFYFSYARAKYHLAGASNVFSISTNISSFKKSKLDGSNKTN